METLINSLEADLS